VDYKKTPKESIYRITTGYFPLISLVIARPNCSIVIVNVRGIYNVITLQIIFKYELSTAANWFMFNTNEYDKINSLRFYGSKAQIWLLIQIVLTNLWKREEI
jgi:hypothetical protein